jgi:hypothetical protein
MVGTCGIANSGSTPDTAIKTFTELNKRLPAMNSGKLHVHLAPGTYPPVPGPLYVPIQTGPDGQELVIIGHMATEATLTNTVADPSGTTLTVAGPLVPNQYRGKFVEITSGNSAGVWVEVATNTATTLSLLQPSLFDFGIGDTFEIKQSDVILDGVSGQFLVLGVAGSNCQIGFTQVKFIGSAALSVQYQLDRCEIDTQGLPFFTNQLARLDVGPLHEETFFDFLLLPAGLWIHGSDSGVGGSFNVSQKSQCFSAIVADDTGFLVSELSIHQCFAIDGLRCAWALDTAKDVVVFGFPLSSMRDLPPGAQFNFEGGPSTAAAVFDIFSDSTLAAMSSVDISNNSVPAFSVTDYSSADLIEVSGTGNVPLGARTENSGRIGFVDGLTTVTGTVDDVQLGPAAPQTWASIAAVPIFSAVSDVRGNVILALF